MGETTDARGLGAARRMVARWVSGGWKDPPHELVFALRVLVESGELPAGAPERDVGWRIVLYGAAGHEERFFDAWREGREQIADASIVRYDAPALARRWPRRGVDLVLRLPDEEFVRAAPALLPGLHGHDALCADVLVRLEREAPDRWLDTLIDELFETRKSDVRSAPLESAWARLSREMSAPGGASHRHHAQWLSGRIRELATSDLEAALALWQAHGGVRGALDFACHDAVLGRWAARDPLRAWQLVEGASDEALATGPHALAGDTPLPAAAVAQLDRLLAAVDCVSEWEDWTGLLVTAVHDGQLELVRRELARLVAEEDAADCVAPTAVELATAVRWRRRHDRASGEALLALLLPLTDGEARDELLLYASLSI